MKQTTYFPHDINSRNDPKIQKLIKDHGYAALGIFWCVVEMLYENNGQLLADEIDTYAFSLSCDPKLLKTVLFHSKLFKREKKIIFSESQTKRMKAIHEKSEKAKYSASKRWGDANAMRTHSDGNAIKEIKLKEKKTIFNIMERVATQ
jgi:hypothetical protein